MPWRPRPAGPFPFAGFFYVLGGVVVPAACFGVAGMGLGPDSREKAWQAYFFLFFHRAVSAGFALLLLAGAVSLCLALANPARHGPTRVVRACIDGGVVVSGTYLVFGALCEMNAFFIPASLAAFAIWGVVRGAHAVSRTVALALLVLGTASLVITVAVEPPLGFVSLASGPAWSFIAYVSMAWRLRRAHGALPIGPLGAWLAAYGAALAYAIIQASRLYRDLPETHPSCYVATAAARGHPRLVKSWRVKGGRVNAQLIWLKRGELALARLAPRVHRRLRRAYDRVGPAVAARMRHPLAADAAYLSLKPLEWAVRAAFLFTPAPRPPILRDEATS